ncbi:MAG: M48 family metalloprotease [Acidobacteria bacterium]|nr:M48 family metalloprotease [Acidobacteriota bacterium]
MARWHRALTPGLGALALVTTLVETQQIRQTNKYSLHGDVELGQAAASEVRLRLPLVSDQVLAAYVGDVGQRLVGAIPDGHQQPLFAYSFEIIDAGDLDAIALPGGPIFVTRGMLDVAETEHDLAALLAHQLSHIVLRDATAQATSGNRFQIGNVTGLGIAAAAVGVSEGIVARAAGFGTTSYFLAYGGEEERRADLLALQMLTDAGYAPRNLSNMFRIIEQETLRSGPLWLSRHPDPGGNDEDFSRHDVIAIEAAILSDDEPPARADRLPSMRARLRLLDATREPAAWSRGRERVAPRAGIGVEVPSGSSVPVRAGDRLQFVAPANWRPQLVDNTVILAPDGASAEVNGRPIVTHGVQVGVARSLTGDLQRDVQALLTALARWTADVQWTPAYQQTTIAGRRGLTTTASSISPATRQFEHVSVSAARLPDGGFLYVIGLAPQDEAGTYRQAFERVLRSLQILE